MLDYGPLAKVFRISSFAKILKNINEQRENSLHLGK